MSGKPVTTERLEELKLLSHRIRLHAMRMVCRSKSAHLGSALSMVDLLTVLYFRFLHIDPKNPSWPQRDRFILSKGHGGSGLYATLAERGFFPVEQLEQYGMNGGHLAVHPSSLFVPGVEASTGSLGHGLPIGLGMAIAAARDNKTYRIVVMLSDGECDEGSTWEAILAAGAWGISNLIAIVDYNKVQSFGRTADVLDLEPFSAKWEACRWGVAEVDGHDHTAIAALLDRIPFADGKPSVLIAHTVKGKGFLGLEDTVDSHYRTPTQEQIVALEHSLSCDA